MRRLARWTAALVVASVSWLTAPGALAQGCAMCRTALEGQEDSLAQALSTSTLVLAAMPFAVVASIGGWLLLALRRAESEARHAAGDPPAAGPDPSGVD